MRGSVKLRLLWGNSSAAATSKMECWGVLTQAVMDGAYSNHCLMQLQEKEYNFEFLSMPLQDICQIRRKAAARGTCCHLTRSDSM